MFWEVVDIVNMRDNADDFGIHRKSHAVNLQNSVKRIFEDSKFTITCLKMGIE